MAFGSRQISLTERSHSSFTLFILVLCAGFSLSLSPDIVSGGSQWKVQALSAGIRFEVRHCCSVSKNVFISRVR
jgi:hypothetical protein